MKTGILDSQRLFVAYMHLFLYLFYLIRLFVVEKIFLLKLNLE